MRLGTGVREFAPVADGDTVYLYKGPQGGYHLYISVQAKGFDPREVRLCYVERFAADGKEFGNGCWLIQLTNDLGDGWRERVGVWGQVNDQYWPHPQWIKGQNITLDVTLTDDDGCRAEAGYRAYVSLDRGM